MSAAERLLDLLRRVAAREDESQVLPALGQRNELLAHVGGDRDLLDAGKILRRVLAVHGHQTPARGIGILITPAACRSRSNESIFQPSAWRRISSSSVMPVPNRRVREQRPPSERAATSMTQGPLSLTLSSAWTGPSVSPSAAHARRVTSAMRACVAAGWREGRTEG